MAKILIAEDSQFMRGVLADILKEMGHEHIEAENGTKAMELITSEKPDLVLLDIIMPETDGISVLQKVGKEAKIVVISAVGQEKMVEQAKTLGAKDYIVKPFENEKVQQVIKQQLGE
jgi:two-component system, chemotaxis family, chemotaxis protein CheY